MRLGVLRCAAPARSTFQGPGEGLCDSGRLCLDEEREGLDWRGLCSTFFRNIYKDWQKVQVSD